MPVVALVNAAGPLGDVHVNEFSTWSTKPELREGETIDNLEADGLELTAIFRQIQGVPFAFDAFGSLKAKQVWRGVLAQFIYENLEL
jgi:hypothetical protein